MTLYNQKKLEHKQAQVGKTIGSQTKLNNYEYGRGKAKKIAVGKLESALNKRK